MIKEQIDTLFSKEMSRKEFLQHIGAGIMIVFGVSGVLKALAGQENQPRKAGLGYGASAYGGQKH